jgi:hypothetical protein
MNISQEAFDKRLAASQKDLNSLKIEIAKHSALLERAKALVNQ